MSSFIRIAGVSDIPNGEGRCFPVGGTMVGVFKEGDNLFAINDFCPHMGASLSEGYVENSAVMCPWHAWRFSLQDGTWLDNSKSAIRTASYEIRVEGSDIFLKVDSDGKPEPRVIS